jgi:hypothetical protein
VANPKTRSLRQPKQYSSRAMERAR